eukprot:328938-Amphidinium_carterae.1
MDNVAVGARKTSSYSQGAPRLAIDKVTECSFSLPLPILSTSERGIFGESLTICSREVHPFVIHLMVGTKSRQVKLAWQGHW